MGGRGCERYEPSVRLRARTGSQSMTPEGWPLSVAKGMCGSGLGQEGL